MSVNAGVPFRTVLFTPADDEQMLRGALDTDADVLFFDLEDGVDPARRDAARSTAARVLGETSPRDRPVFVRVNAPDSGRMEEDVHATGEAGVDGFVVPGVESPEDVRAVRQVGRETAGSDEPLDLIPIVESAAGVRRTYEVARAEGVHRLALGSMDLLRDLGARWTPGGETLTGVRSRLVIDSRAAGIEAPLDTVWPKLKDPEGLGAEARRSADMGFQGKMLLHPAQIEPVREAFTPSRDELEWARKVVEAFESREDDRGSIAVEGEFVDRPVYERARRVLARGPSP